MKTVDMVVSEWSDEERERLKDLIEECRERERQLIENSRTCRKNLTRLNDALIFLFSKSYEIREKTEKLADDLLEIYLNFYNKEMASS